MLGAAHCILHMPEREDDGLKAYAARNCQLESQGNKKLRQIALELESACDRKLRCKVEHNRHCCTDRPAATCTRDAPLSEKTRCDTKKQAWLLPVAERLIVTEAIR